MLTDSELSSKASGLAGEDTQVDECYRVTGLRRYTEAQRKAAEAELFESLYGLGAFKQEEIL